MLSVGAQHQVVQVAVPHAEQVHGDAIAGAALHNRLEHLPMRAKVSGRRDCRIGVIGHDHLGLDAVLRIGARVQLLQVAANVVTMLGEDLRAAAPELGLLGCGHGWGVMGGRGLRERKTLWDPLDHALGMRRGEDAVGGELEVEPCARGEGQMRSRCCFVRGSWRLAAPCSRSSWSISLSITTTSWSCGHQGRLDATTACKKGGRKRMPAACRRRS